MSKSLSGPDSISGTANRQDELLNANSKRFFGKVPFHEGWMRIFHFVPPRTHSNSKLNIHN